MRVRNLRRRLQRGTVSIWMALGAIPLASLMGFGIDLTNVVNARASVQNYVDAKAVAGLKELILAPVQQIDVGDFVNFHFEGDIGYTDEVPIKGAWNFTDPIPAFRPGGGELPGVPAMHVSIEDADDFRYPLFFGGLLGVPTVTMNARATAFTGARHVVLVQDVSGSMGLPQNDPPINLARAALQNFVAAMGAQDLPGDQVGLVVFASEGPNNQPETQVIRGLTPLHGGGVGTLTGSIGGITTQSVTNQAAGIALARGLFTGPPTHLVNRIMVIVSDGGPSEFNGSFDRDCDPHVAAAQQAHLQDGIDVFSVFIRSGSTQPGDEECSRRFAQGRGTPYPINDASALDDVLVDIVSRVPVRLVE